MKSLLTPIILLSGYFSFSQADEIVIPANTPVTMELSEQIREGKNKLGESARFVISQDVVIDGALVISKNTLVHATITTAKRGDLRVDIYDVAATDGTVLKLNDCWIFTTAAQNLNSRGFLLAKGTKKNCSTTAKATVKKMNKQF